MDIIGAKLLSACIFFFVAVFFSFLPCWAIRCYFRKRSIVAHYTGAQQILFVQCLYSLASGVLIGTCLIHLLPESLETFQESVRSRNNHNRSQSHSTNHTANFTDNVQDPNTDQYPLAELLVALGFLCVYMLDNGVKSCSKHEKKANRADSEINEEDVVFLTTDEPVSNQNTTTQDTRIRHTRRESCQARAHLGVSKLQYMLKGVTAKLSKSVAPYAPVGQTEDEADQERLAPFSESDIINSHNPDTHLPNWPLDASLDVKIPSTHRSVFTGSLQTTVHESQTHSSQTHESQTHESQMYESQTFTKSNHLRSAALVAALCVHGIFDGIIVGLQTSPAVVLSLAFAISLHKSFVCVGLSLSLLRTTDKHNSKMSICIFVLLFAVASPLGVLVSGLFLHEVAETGSGVASMTPACVQSFAVGTFMYVAVLETIERHQSKTLRLEIIKQMFLLSGFGLMAGLRAALGDS